MAIVKEDIIKKYQAHESDRGSAPVQIAILTISDTRDASQDKSGDLLAERATTAGHVVRAREIVTDDAEKILAEHRALMEAEQWSISPCTAKVGDGVVEEGIPPSK